MQSLSKIAFYMRLNCVWVKLFEAVGYIARENAHNLAKKHHIKIEYAYFFGTVLTYGITTLSTNEPKPSLKLLVSHFISNAKSAPENTIIPLLIPTSSGKNIFFYLKYNIHKIVTYSVNWKFEIWKHTH